MKPLVTGTAGTVVKVIGALALVYILFILIGGNLGELFGSKTSAPGLGAT